MRRVRIIFLNVGFWMLYAFLLITFFNFFTLSHIKEKVDFSFFASIFIFLLITPAIVSYFSFYFLIHPYYAKTKSSLKTIGTAFSILILNSICCSLLLEYQIEKNITIFRIKSFVYPMSVFILFIGFVVGSIAFTIRTFISWFDDQQIKKELQEQNHQMELALVKARLDPHFLFNTLNNIDVLIELEPKNASTYLNKLSDIMRFMLFETKSDKINLNQEIEYLEKFVDLQKIRSATKDFVQLKIEGEGNPKITPMVFIPFVENAFKHVGNTSEKSAIQIELRYNENEISFSCQNSFTNDENNSIKSNKVGHELIERRIQLNYPDHHKLNITTENNIYTVTLLLNLNEN